MTHRMHTPSASPDRFQRSPSAISRFTAAHLSLCLRSAALATALGALSSACGGAQDLDLGKDEAALEDQANGANAPAGTQAPTAGAGHSTGNASATTTATGTASAPTTANCVVQGVGTAPHAGGEPAPPDQAGGCPAFEPGSPNDPATPCAGVALPPCPAPDAAGGSGVTCAVPAQGDPNTGAGQPPPPSAGTAAGGGKGQPGTVISGCSAAGGGSAAAPAIAYPLPPPAAGGQPCSNVQPQPTSPSSGASTAGGGSPAAGAEPVATSEE
jgi:hypothetical protein